MKHNNDNDNDNNNEKRIEIDIKNRQDQMMISMIISGFVREGCKIAVAVFCSEEKPEMEEAKRLWGAFAGGRHPKVLDMIYGCTKKVHQHIHDMSSDGGSIKLIETEIVGLAAKTFTDIFTEKDTTEFLRAILTGDVFFDDAFNPQEYMAKLSSESGGPKTYDPETDSADLKAAVDKLREAVQGEDAPKAKKTTLPDVLNMDGDFSCN